MKHQLQAIATVLSLVNPAICGAMFQKIEAGRSSKAQLGDATKAVTAIFVILGVAALVGARVLQMFGISLDAFSVAGGHGARVDGFFDARLQACPADSRSGWSLCQRVTDSRDPVAASPGTITGVTIITGPRA